MGAIVLGRSEFRDRVYACWIGKNIGGTLGAPWECKKFVNNLTFYSPVPTEPLPNDDLDLQLVWLKMLEDRGTSVTTSDFADYWTKYLLAYPWNEYGFCSRNLDRGLVPPISGWFENYYVDEMGSPIRSEIWACVAPADPERAAALAWMDSAMDHAGGEGMWGEMFWAAVESAAFVEWDPYTLIRIGLNMIPPSCNIARVIREAVWCRQHEKPWAEARDRIARIFGNDQPCNAVQNHGFTIVGWLYGEDFGDKLCKAVNCGYDTDCTGATLGSVLGIIGGAAGIPQEWIDPIGLSIKLCPFTGSCSAPATIEELTDRTVAMAEKFAAERPQVMGFADKTILPPGCLETRLSCNKLAVAAAQRDLRSAVRVDKGTEIIFHYHGDPVLRPGIPGYFTVTLVKNSRHLQPARVELEVPAGWQTEKQGEGFLVTAPEFIGAARITVKAQVDGDNCTASFTVLSPSEAPGFPSAANIEYCPVCHGRKGSCICKDAAN